MRQTTRAAIERAREREQSRALLLEPRPEAAINADVGWVYVCVQGNVSVRIGAVHARKECGDRADSGARPVQISLSEVAEHPLLCDLRFCQKCFAGRGPTVRSKGE